MKTNQKLVDEVVREFPALGKYRVRLLRAKSGLALDLREYITGESFEGFTRRGMRLDLDQVELLLAFLPETVERWKREVTPEGPGGGEGAPFEKGDRIELVSMPEDPCPVAPGTRGTVLDCHRHVLGPRGERQFWQVYVGWDDRRGLMLVVPPDVARKIEKEKP